ncbi:MAG: TlpA family protein disulfide reductase [Labilithrix sp.]|nr:TlpA family protein disulfide reductase [Labilithrix sp.]MCW5814181.1 TlpA family protein disulfide reductase [Labilithrix sp.]
MKMRAALALVLVLLGACNEEAKDPTSTSSADTKAEISCTGKPEVGKLASSFSLASVNGGRKMTIEKGKVTVIDFWATWCEPCKKSFPKYQDLYTKYQANGLEVLAVSTDDEDNKIAGFISAHGAKFPVGWDAEKKIADCYHPPNMPSAYVIDKTGTIRHIHTGFRDGEEKEIEKEIKELL